VKKPDRSKNTPGADAAFDLLGRVAVDPDTDERYPNETACWRFASSGWPITSGVSATGQPSCPREWVTEFHAAGAAGGHKLAA
jgi:hypothetical protein